MTSDNQTGGIGVGDELSGYRLTALLGEGGMATVFRGENALDPSIVRAIKIVHAELGARKEFVKRFAVEARTLERLSHPNVVRFFGVRQERGRLVMELELLEGETLAAKLAKGLPLADVTSWMLQATEGLVAAHALGVLHRDIKPENLFLTTDGVVKVLDFGIARALDEAAGNTRQTEAGTTPGTAAYLAPESWKGAAPSAATDVYAVGLTLLELAFGHHPFMAPEQRRSSAQLMYAHLEEVIPRLRSVRAEASAALDALAAKATSRDPAQRYATTQELALALREALAAERGATGAGAAKGAAGAASTSFALAQFDPSTNAGASAGASNGEAGGAPAPSGQATAFAIDQFDGARHPPRESGRAQPATPQTDSALAVESPAASAAAETEAAADEIATPARETRARPRAALYAVGIGALAVVGVAGAMMARTKKAPSEPDPSASASASGVEALAVAASASPASSITPPATSGSAGESATARVDGKVDASARPGDPAKARTAALKEAAEFGMIQPWGREDAGPIRHNDDNDALGAGGLGLSGVGAGGGQWGDGIGLGNIGTLGHGAGTGTGQGFGSSGGRVGGARTAKPPSLRELGGEIKGALPPDVVKRILRQNFGRFRLCYEMGLKKDPKLAGKVTAKFVIDKSGAVAGVQDGGSTLGDASVVQCVLRAYAGLSFPEPEGGGSVTVTYPIEFNPGE